MSYQLPLIEELQSLAKTLEDGYQGSNPERKNFIHFIKKVTSDPAILANPNAVKIILGAYLFEMEWIENTYRMRSKRNSRLFVLMEKGLNISKDNLLPHEKKLVYLAAFYNYVRLNAEPNFSVGTTWNSNDVLCKNLSSTLISLLSKQYEKVQCVLSALPKYSQLCNNFKNVSQRYDKLSPPGYLFGGAHSQQAKLIDFMNEYCEEYLPVVTENEADPATWNHESYKLRMGVIVYTMKNIENSKWFTSGKSSHLHNMCGHGVTGKNGMLTTDFDLDKKITWLNTFVSNVQNILDNRKPFIEEMKAKDKKAYKYIEDDLRKMIGEIWRMLGAYTAERDAPSRLQSHMSSATTVVAQNGVNSFFKNAVGEIPAPIGALMDSAAGVTGFAILGPGGAVLGSTLSKLVRENLVPILTAGLISSALDKVGATVGAGITGVVIFPFRIIGSGVQSLANYCGGPGFDKNLILKDEEYIQALMSLTDDIFAPNKKARIETTLGVRSMSLQ